MNRAPIVFGELTESCNNDPQLKQVEWSYYKSSGFAFHYNPPLPLASRPFTFGNTSLHFLMHQYDLISLCSSEETPFPHPIEYSFSLKSPEGNLIGTKTFVSTIGRTTKDGCVYSVEEVIRKNPNYRFSPGRINVIVCQLRIKSEAIKTDNLNVESNSTPLVHWRLAETDVLSKNLKDLYLNKVGCDTVLQVKGKEFDVHKAILIGRSSVFAAMFQHDTSESQTGIIKISDCDPDTFHEFLEYLYSGKLEHFSSDTALHLYKTSDKYDVQELKTFCTTYLMRALTAQNVCDVVMLADQYDETELFSAAQTYFNENMKEIFITAEWANLFKANFRLANKLLIQMSNSKE